RSFSFGVSDPAAATPERSPLTSARNTGTPIREKLSASTWSVTVLPVPVAPVMRPWRLASPGRNTMSLPAAVLATRNGSVMGQSKMRHEYAREFWALALFLVLEIHERVAAIGSLSGDRVAPAPDIVRIVPFVAETEVRTVRRDAHGRRHPLAV